MFTEMQQQQKEVVEYIDAGHVVNRGYQSKPTTRLKALQKWLVFRDKRKKEYEGVTRGKKKTATIKSLK